MSTKGLMAHKKVASVTTHGDDMGKLAGKAATLTLAAPWLFDGGRGPFTLKNVEHGHDIVRAAYDERHGPGATSTRKEGGGPKTSAPRPVTRGVVSDPSQSDLPIFPARPHERPAQFTGRDPLYIWRWTVVSETAVKRISGQYIEPEPGHEISGWFMTSSKEGKPTAKALRDKALAHARRSMVVGHEDSYTATVAQFTVEDERKAKARKEAGSPWSQEHLILGDPK